MAINDAENNTIVANNGHRVDLGGTHNRLCRTVYNRIYNFPCTYPIHCIFLEVFFLNGVENFSAQIAIRIYFMAIK